MSHVLPRDELSEFLSGYKKTIADERAEGNMSQHEGKRPVTLETFRKLATFSFRCGYEASQNLINTLFIILCWNLMSRSISVARLLYNHITWIGDALARRVKMQIRNMCTLIRMTLYFAQYCI